ncbi:LexA family transcriptional regulator [Ottowia sp.]|uniref:LexA family transcriptional regulator n=1 Tax=Ottowia sp. TaxID=1898956 RepID=UPI003A8B461E
MLIAEHTTQAAFAEAIGKSSSQVGQWLSSSGRGRRMSPATAREIEVILGKPMGWMDQPIQVLTHTTIAPALSPGRPLVNSVAIPKHIVEATQVQAHGGDPDGDYIAIRRTRLKLSAGVNGFAVDHLDDDHAPPLWFQRAWIAKQGWREGQLLALKVTGRSMEPGLYAGDTVLINTASTTPVDGVVFAVNYDGEPIIKRLVDDAGQWWLASDNPSGAYPRMPFTPGSFVVGEVVHKQSQKI